MGKLCKPSGKHKLLDCISGKNKKTLRLTRDGGWSVSEEKVCGAPDRYRKCRGKHCILRA